MGRAYMRSHLQQDQESQLILDVNPCSIQPKHLCLLRTADLDSQVDSMHYADYFPGTFTLNA